jgi:hypothetical protein
MSEHTYTFENVENPYFMGRDVRVTRDDGESVIIGRRDGFIAVNVKDDVLLWREGPTEVVKIAELLGETRVQQLYERVQADYWQWAEDALAANHGFSGVYQEGRSGGWLAVAGTQDWEDYAVTQPDLIEDPDERAEAEGDRKRFLELAFEADAAVESYREEFYTLLRDEAPKHAARAFLHENDLSELELVVYEVLSARAEDDEDDAFRNAAPLEQNEYLVYQARLLAQTLRPMIDNFSPAPFNVWIADKDGTTEAR